MWRSLIAEFRLADQATAVLCMSRACARAADHRRQHAYQCLEGAARALPARREVRLAGITLAVVRARQHAAVHRRRGRAELAR
eukprot:205357-Prymnesium_polylepis.1